MYRFRSGTPSTFPIWYIGFSQSEPRSNLSGRKAAIPHGFPECGYLPVACHLLSNMKNSRCSNPNDGIESQSEAFSPCCLGYVPGPMRRIFFLPVFLLRPSCRRASGADLFLYRLCGLESFRGRTLGPGHDGIGGTGAAGPGILAVPGPIRMLDRIRMAAVFPVQERTETHGVGVAALLISPPIASQFFFGFHPEFMGAPLLVLAMIAYRKRRLNAFLILTAMVSYCKEPFTLAIAGILPVAAVERRDWKWIILPGLLCSAQMKVYW
jgi:hypothetical protein